MDVYQLELRFITWVTGLLQELSQLPGAKTREVHDHLDRASLSALFNTAEGNGKRQRPIRAKFFDDARGSAKECAACLDALVAKGTITDERIREGKTLLLRIVSMLTKLVHLYSSDHNVREDEEQYMSTLEGRKDENDDEDDRLI
ncbi:MAG: four helix bundle protein [Acidobacteria bacterium]|nr:MAG: four helix bundle protein [Acidobacteriota bacterium]